jgi:hypothetical protein
MWRRLWLLLVIPLVSSSQSASQPKNLADTTIGEYIKAKDSPVLKAYIVGVASGLVMANKELEKNGTRLFCRLDSAPLNPQTLLDGWIAKEVAKIGHVADVDNPLLLQVAVLIAFEDAFPCSAEK